MLIFKTLIYYLCFNVVCGDLHALNTEFAPHCFPPIDHSLFLALSFLLPLISRLVNSTRPEERDSPRAVILAPTRELCMQIEEQAKQIMTG